MAQTLTTGQDIPVVDGPEQREREPGDEDHVRVLHVVPEPDVPRADLEIQHGRVGEALDGEPPQKLLNGPGGKREDDSIHRHRPHELIEVVLLVEGLLLGSGAGGGLARVPQAQRAEDGGDEDGDADDERDVFREGREDVFHDVLLNCRDVACNVGGRCRDGIACHPREILAGRHECLQPAEKRAVAPHHMGYRAFGVTTQGTAIPCFLLAAAGAGEHTEDCRVGVPVQEVERRRLDEHLGQLVLGHAHVISGLEESSDLCSRDFANVLRTGLQDGPVGPDAQALVGDVPNDAVHVHVLDTQGANLHAEGHRDTHLEGSQQTSHGREGRAAAAVQSVIHFRIQGHGATSGTRGGEALNGVHEIRVKRTVEPVEVRPHHLHEAGGEDVHQVIELQLPVSDAPDDEGLDQPQVEAHGDRDLRPHRASGEGPLLVVPVGQLGQGGVLVAEASEQLTDQLRHLRELRDAGVETGRDAPEPGGQERPGVGSTGQVHQHPGPHGLELASQGGKPQREGGLLNRLGHAGQVTDGHRDRRTHLHVLERGRLVDTEEDAVAIRPVARLHDQGDDRHHHGRHGGDQPHHAIQQGVVGVLEALVCEEQAPAEHHPAEGGQAAPEDRGRHGPAARVEHVEGDDGAA